MSKQVQTAPDIFPFEAQFSDVRELSERARDALIVSTIQVEGHWLIRSRYGDDCWQLAEVPSNMQASRRRLDFLKTPAPFRAVMKAIMYRYLRRGREGQRRPKGLTLCQFFFSSMPFLRYLDTLKIETLKAASPAIMLSYATNCSGIIQRNGKGISKYCLSSRLNAVEALYELSQYTHDPIPTPPWPGSSSTLLAGLTGKFSRSNHEGKTPLIPDEVFCSLFEKAYEEVQRGAALLDLRDALSFVDAKLKLFTPQMIALSKKRKLVALGWKDGLASFNRAVLRLRTACYIVLASTTGCRNHELANLKLASHHRTQDNEGTTFHWMRSLSEKTNAGMCDWMIPEAAVRALRLMERWSAPYQMLIAEEIAARRRLNPQDPEIANAQKHLHSLFLGSSDRNLGQVRTLSCTACNHSLKVFARNTGQTWSLSSHQFRRKFANYVAHSRFGDLRYLREHFAHWSMDMTLGYAMDKSWGAHLDLDLYDEIQSEFDDMKHGTVNAWLDADSLAGGYGRSFKNWQRDPMNLAIFKDHKTMVISITESTAIRSNGHAWCTADSDGCVGNTFERTRCSNCGNGVIDGTHLHIYMQLYKNLGELLTCSDIGDSGRLRVQRDMERCRDVFLQLGHDFESTPHDNKPQAI